MKDVTGYDMLHLMVGSEGTLGIFTKIILKLIPLPKSKANLLVLFKELQSAIDIVPELMTQTGIIPTAVEFMDTQAAQYSCRYLNEHLDYKNAKAMLLIEVDANNDESIESCYEPLGELCLQRGAIEVYVADNATTQERVWKIRRNIAEALSVYSKVRYSEDIAVPPAQITDLVRKIESIAAEYNIPVPVFGHAGDGNLHIYFVKPPEMTMEKWNLILPEARNKLYTFTSEIGGTISGEHGIGSKRKNDIGIFLQKEVIELMKKIKNAFDPNDILNPGKIFPDNS